MNTWAPLHQNKAQESSCKAFDSHTAAKIVGKSPAKQQNTDDLHGKACNFTKTLDVPTQWSEWVLNFLNKGKEIVMEIIKQKMLCYSACQYHFGRTEIRLICVNTMI